MQECIGSKIFNAEAGPVISSVATILFDHCVRFNPDVDRVVGPSSVPAMKGMATTSQSQLATGHLRRHVPAKKLRLLVN